MISSGFHVQLADYVVDHALLRAVREPVFLVEQSVPPEIETDELDPQSRHVVARDDEGRPIGTGRLAPTRRIGRMAVLPEWRGRGVGAAMLQTLLDLSRELRYGTVDLHAQWDAIGFYEGFGFQPVGEEFLEAGIRHQRMQLTLVPHEPLRRPPPPPTPPARLIEANSFVEVRDLLMQLFEDTRRQLWICSRDLDALLLGSPEAQSALRRIATAGNGSQVRVLVQQPQAAFREGHPLIPLGQRLSSVVSFRTPVEDPDLQYPSAFVLNDRGGYLFRPLASRFEAAADRYGPARHRQLREYFSQVWERSEPTTLFRALHL